MSAEQEKELNLQRAREVAYQCMLEYGVNGTTHEMVARKTGLGLRTLRRYFRTKVDLVCDVMQTVGIERFNAFCAKIIASIPADDTGLEQLRQLHYRMFDCCKGECSPWLLISELELFWYENHVPRETLTLYLQTIQKKRTYAKQMIRKGIADGSMREDIDPDAYATLLANSYVGMLQRMESIRYTKTVCEFTSFAEQVDLYIAGVMTVLQKSSPSPCGEPCCPIATKGRKE